MTRALADGGDRSGGDLVRVVLHRRGRSERRRLLSTKLIISAPFEIRVRHGHEPGRVGRLPRLYDRT
eukprot:11665902-Prorocentrum_lima.AAC.1